MVHKVSETLGFIGTLRVSEISVDDPVMLNTVLSLGCLDQQTEFESHISLSNDLLLSAPILVGVTEMIKVRTCIPLRSLPTLRLHYIL